MASKQIAPLIYITLSVFVLSNVGIAQGLLMEQMETQELIYELEGKEIDSINKTRNSETTKNKSDNQQIHTPEQRQEQTQGEEISSDRKSKKSKNHIKKVLEDYPGYIKITNSQMFDDYVNNLPAEKLKTVKQILEYGERDEIIELISAYLKQEDYQRGHVKFITNLVKNYTGMNRQILAKNAVRDWIKQVGENIVVRNLRIKEINNKSASDTYPYLVYYTLVRGTFEEEHLYLVDTFEKSVRSIWLNPEIRKSYNLY